MRRSPGLAVVTVAAAATIAAATMTAAPAVAAPGTSPIDFGSLSLPLPGAPGGNLGTGHPLGVVAISTRVTNSLGRELAPNRYSRPFAPTVTWSTHTRSAAPVRGNNCQIEVTFTGTTHPTHKSTACQGSVEIPSSYYTQPGFYTITAAERIAFVKNPKSFSIE
ncbi:hypothetical protein GDN83_09000 [Gordonia jinghuaiqii]|uniref:Uncharacterized protein n=1 Tax=Gordonia jinghuaiqii TaxID=2758710 RepID=A0A7D7QR39_9ACTN|nr:hypothetical protein [Gordonia jinghuaiqii]MCR5977869.1 hypothetical protein [Gordonia jinghuaiqii]QMT02526.1 hypothetical protein H1R19_05070 [Gordonia jinghuaiqii]